jgi:polysaccharide deacetylase family protein (PEP-CTERM system associated)
MNALSIDLEDGWYIFSRDWLLQEAEPAETVVRDTETILGILAKKDVKATFFVLGVVAAKFPKLVKRISECGHELGIHGYTHRQIFKLDPSEFREEVSKTKKLLEDIISGEVSGHRAAAFSIMPETKWALEILAEEGFSYDSSVVPFKNPRYGWRGFSEDICRVDLGGGLSIVEVPMTAIRIPLLNKGFLTGGGYLRHFPYWIFKGIVRHIQKQRPVIVYVHPYEFGTDRLTLSCDHLSNKQKGIAHRYLKVAMRNRETVPDKVLKLLCDFEFTTMRNVVKESLAGSNESRIVRLK